VPGRQTDRAILFLNWAILHCGISWFEIFLLLFDLNQHLKLLFSLVSGTHLYKRRFKRGLIFQRLSKLCTGLLGRITYVEKQKGQVPEIVTSLTSEVLTGLVQVKQNFF
jgi:uncharacterized membrane protein